MTVTGGAGRGGSPLGARRYAAGAVVVLFVAAALRFYDLAADSLWYDEAVAALNSQGSFTETVERTRAFNTSPILYPLALWAVQKVEISNFSVRLLPALGSAATVAVLLFLLPGAGAGRRTALFAGTLAAVSSAAVAEAHGVREYSLDALAAALLLVGLLRHLGGRGRVLLPLALFPGPFVQYGLVLFGGAVLAVAFLFGGGSGDRPPTVSPRRGGGFGAALRARLRLVPAAAAFAAACAGSYFATLRGQLEDGSLTMGHLLPGYYGGDRSDVLAAMEFAGSKVWETLAHHLTGPFTSATALAAGLLVASGLARRLASRPPAPREADRRPDLAGRGLLALFGVSLLIAAAAALTGAYPLGPLRQSTYLGPVVFAAAAVVWGRFADAAAAALRRPVAAGGLAAAALAGGLWAGARETAREAPFGVGGNTEEVLAELAGRAKEGDLIYVSGVGSPPVRFYLRDRPEGLVFGRNGCFRGFTDCAQEMLEIVRSRIRAPDRAWVVHTERSDRDVPNSLRASNPALQAGRVVSGRQDLFLISNLGEVVAAENRIRLAEYESVFDDRAEEPAAVSFFELHHREDFLYYRRAACSAEDLEARFFLHFRAAGAAGRRTVNRDFDFREYGVVADGKCVARVPVPPGDFDLVSTGQWFPGEPPLWEAQWRLDLVAALRAIRSGEIGPPALRGPFDLYLRGRELLYFKEPCAPEDVRPDFLLHLFDHDRVGRGARRDFENRDFGFDGMGVVRGGACLASVRLPDRRIASVRTGQWSSGQPASWTGVARVDFERHRAALDAIVSGQAGPSAARGTFDLYRDGRRLLYHREDCREEDVEADFFLDLHPSEVESLPLRRREEGFEDLHFPFSNHGVVLDGQCLLLVTVPDYRIRRLVTGQFVPDGGTLWQVEIEPGG